MTKQHDASEAFIDIFSIFADECRVYSGRGMYGAECFAIDCANPMEVIADIVAALDDALIGLENPSDLILEISEAIRGSKIDSMGLGRVLYFPMIKPFDSES